MGPGKEHSTAAPVSPSTPVEAWQHTGLQWSGAKVNRRDKNPWASVEKQRGCVS